MAAALPPDPARPARPARPTRPSRQGLWELLLVAGFLSLAVAGALALFGDELRQALGLRPAPTAGPAPSRPP